MVVPHYPNKPSLRVNWLSRQVFRLNARQIPNSRYPVQVDSCPEQHNANLRFRGYTSARTPPAVAKHKDHAGPNLGKRCRGRPSDRQKTVHNCTEMRRETGRAGAQCSLATTGPRTQNLRHRQYCRNFGNAQRLGRDITVSFGPRRWSDRRQFCTSSQ
jgi:hypothetical protein